ncbi:MAG: hypothetical protein U0X74_04820 [Anaerolineales bacterium]
MKLESKKRLNDFVERAERIRNYSYFDNGEKIVGFKVRKLDVGMKIDYYQPDNEKLDAISTTLRLFFQNKDGISFRKMAELCDDPDISKEWKEEFNFYRNNQNLMFEEIVIEGDKGKLTNKEILDMFLYGKLVHNIDDDNHKLYKKWVNNETEYEILYNMFHVVLVRVLTTVLNISSICKKEILRHNI